MTYWINSTEVIGDVNIFSLLLKYDWIYLFNCNHISKSKGRVKKRETKENRDEVI